MNKSGKIGLGEKIGYGTGDLACCAIFAFVGSYITYFYTDVAGISVLLVAAVLSVARIIDAVVNPIVGIVVDRVNTPKGRARPFVLYTAVPLGLFAFLMLAASYVPQRFRAVYAIVTYLGFLVVYSLDNIPYSALMPNMTDDQSERATLNQFRTYGMALGTLVASVGAVRMVGLFGGGNEQKGYFCLGIFFFFYLSIGMLTCYFSVRERIITPVAPLTLSSIKATVKTGKPWIILCISMLLIYMGNMTKSAAVVYYSKYVLGRTNLSAILLALQVLAILVLAITYPKLSARFPKRRLQQVGSLLYVAATLLVWLFKTNTVMILILTLIAYLGVTVATTGSYLMLSDTIDHSEYMTGIRQQGLITSMYAFFVKVGVALSSILMPILLEAGGYVADAEQSASSLLTIRALFTIVPAAAVALSALVLQLYTLDKDHPMILKALAEKHAAKNV